MFECRSDGNRIRLRTPFLYPDGDLIDVFVYPSGSGWVLSDMGEAVRYLSMSNVDLRTSPKRQAQLHEAVGSLGATLFDGSIQTQVRDLTELPDAVLRLGQAITRACDLVFTLRARSYAEFREEVRGFLTQHQLDFEEEYQVQGGSGETYRVDFGVRTGSEVRLLRLVTTTSPGSANQVIDGVVREWVDIAMRVTDPSQRISLFDDRLPIWREPWINLAGTFSIVTYWTQPEGVYRALRAA